MCPGLSGVEGRTSPDLSGFVRGRMILLSTWGSLPAAERTARLRALQVLVHVFAGPTATAFEALRAAETDMALLPIADAVLAALPTVPLRRILCTFAATLG